MPNHVTTKMRVTGPAEAVARFRAAHLRKNEDANPMDEGDQYQFDLSSVVPRPAELEGTVAAGAKEDAENPKNIAALAATGYPNWHAWTTEKWGTKWNSYEFRWVDDEPEKLVFTFETAWSMPEPILQKLVKRYPELMFVTMSFDEMWNWAAIGAAHDTPKGREFRLESAVCTPNLYKAVYGIEWEPETEDDPVPEPLTSKEIH
jgi:hypothetical protein